MGLRLPGKVFTAAKADFEPDLADWHIEQRNGAVKRVRTFRQAHTRQKLFDQPGVIGPQGLTGPAAEKLFTKLPGAGSGCHVQMPVRVGSGQFLHGRLESGGEVGLFPRERTTCTRLAAEVTISSGLGVDRLVQVEGAADA